MLILVKDQCKVAHPNWVGRFGPAHWPGGRGPLIADMFSGCGGFSLGFRSAGFRLAFAVEHDEVAAEAYRRNFSNTTIFERDIRWFRATTLLSETNIEPGELGLVVGGAPCQGYSYIGRRLVTDARNTLYQKFVRMIEVLRPKAYLFENVPGMRTMDNGRFFRHLLSSLQSLGYSADCYEINAATHGVPQLRTRMFIAGRLDNQTVTLSNGRLGPEDYITVAEALDGLPCDLSAIRPEGSFELPYTGPCRSEYGRLMRRGKRIVKNCAPTNHGASLLRRLERLGPGEMDLPTKHRRLDASLPSLTIRAGSRTRTACRPIHPTEARVITIRESARICSFPDEFWLPDKKAPAHMLLGNSVPPLLVYHLAMQIARQIF